MDITVIGLIVVGIFGLVFGIYVFTGKGASKPSKSATKKSSVPVKANEKNTDAKEEVKGLKRKNDTQIPRKDIFSFMEFDKIVDDMIIQDGGKKYTMVLQCKGINYDLMSDIEQMAVEEGFITFLNTLKFPIQLYVQARAVDLKQSMNVFDKSVKELESKFNEADEKYKKLAGDLNSGYTKINEAKFEREKFANMLDYARDITHYVEKISLNKNILQRKFYIVLSYNRSEIVGTNEFSKEELHEICYRELYTRAQSLKSALMSCSVSSEVLDSNELAELLYISYNRDDEKIMDVRTALESGFYRLYTTSKDVFEKKNEMLQEEINQEAQRRVKRAIEEILNGEEVKTEDELKEDFEDSVDKQAVAIVEDSDVDDKTKDILIDKIAENHVKGVVERQQKREQKLKQIEAENKEREEAEIKEKVEEKVEDAVKDEPAEAINTNDSTEDEIVTKEQDDTNENDSIV